MDVELAFGLAGLVIVAMLAVNAMFSRTVTRFERAVAESEASNERVIHALRKAAE